MTPTTPRDALIKARDRFREYEAAANGRAVNEDPWYPGNSASGQEAARNKAMADELDEVLARMGGDGGELRDTPYTVPDTAYILAARDLVETRKSDAAWRPDRVLYCDLLGVAEKLLASLSAIRARSEG